MHAVNQTRKTILAEKIITPNTLFNKSLGLLRYKTPSAMLLQTRFGIHTFGMSYQIDVLILNKQNQVVAYTENLPPNRIYMWNIVHKTVIELPPKTIKKTKTEIGDTIRIVK